jgi:hypothetical protein
MSQLIEIQGLKLSQSDIEEISELISQNPTLSCFMLSRQLCEQWNWRSSNGQLKDMASRSLLNKLEKKGYIKLPPKRSRYPKRMQDNSNRLSLLPPVSPYESIPEAFPLAIELIKSNSYSQKLFSTLLARHHYLGYKGSVGEQMSYLVWDVAGNPLCCVLFGAAAWRVSARDRFIGWEDSARRFNLHKVVNNQRFLLLKRVPNLGSYILSRICRRLCGDFMEKYGHHVVLLETFVEKERFLGTCYQASNWEYVGETAGTSRNNRNKSLQVPIKQIYVYPLVKRFREELKNKAL